MLSQASPSRPKVSAPKPAARTETARPKIMSFSLKRVKNLYLILAVLLLIGAVVGGGAVLLMKR